MSCSTRQRRQHQRDQLQQQRIGRLVHPGVVVVRLKCQPGQAWRVQRDVHLDEAGAAVELLLRGLRLAFEIRTRNALVDRVDHLGRRIQLLADLVGIVGIHNAAAGVPDRHLGEVPVGHPIGNCPVKIASGPRVTGQQIGKVGCDHDSGQPLGHLFGVLQGLGPRNVSAREDSHDGHDNQCQRRHAVEKGQFPADTESSASATGSAAHQVVPMSPRFCALMTASSWLDAPSFACRDFTCPRQVFRLMPRTWLIECTDMPLPR